jgi:diguanylate cyclase
MRLLPRYRQQRLVSRLDPSEVRRRMSRLKAWWSQPDQFNWITTYLRQRGLLRSTRMIMVVVAGSSALVPLTVLPSQYRPSAVEMVVGGIVAAFTVGMTVLWLTRWPTRWQSQVGVVIGALGIGGWSLVQPTAALAALACTAMAVPGGYIAFFHSPRLLLFNCVAAAAFATAAALRLSREVDIATAASAFWVINFLNLSFPLAIWGMSRAMGRYVQRSTEDALTGLLNRRAFNDAISRHLANPPPAHTHLAVVMVDLDDFKRINDTHGHSIGDRTLREVAELLREHAPSDAVVCRAGGEEFLIALTSVSSDVGPLAAQFCAAVAKLSPAVTASIGTVSAELHLLTRPDGATLAEELIAIADRAMYAAKRSGGNQAHHSAPVAENAVLERG